MVRLYQPLSHTTIVCYYPVPFTLSDHLQTLKFRSAITLWVNVYGDTIPEPDVYRCTVKLHKNMVVVCVGLALLT